MELAPGDTFGRYTIEEQLGQGGMGRVYRARDERLRRRVALKVLRLDRLEDAGAAVPRLLREARAAAALDHPGSVAIFDVGEVSGVPFIAMEHVVGRSLRSYVGDTTVPVAERLRWLREIARVLAVAHAAGLVHRDIKPENVMVRTDGAVKVLDFGIARRLETDDAPLTRRTATVDPYGAALDESHIVGTPAYMAPEQVQRRPVDARADQFAWGVVAYELLRGALPWQSASEGVPTLVAVVTERPPRLSQGDGVPGQVALVIERALEKEPEQRFPGMPDLLAALESAVGVSGSDSAGHGHRRGGSRSSSLNPGGNLSLNPGGNFGSNLNLGGNFASDGTLFVGREAELAMLRSWVAQGKRLVTILGPPGVGKTRLARVAAERDLAPMFAGRVWYIDLSEAEGVADMVHAAARALGASMTIEVDAQASIDPLASMLEGLGPAAIVFDNIDQIAARHADVMGRLLDRAPGVCIVATSRERLLVRGEHVLELGPLAVPAEGEVGASVERSPAVTLFVDRTRAVRPSYALDEGELGRVSEIVRRLDGLPLAIELAAARMTILDAQGLLRRLDRSIDLLRRDRRDGASRQTSVEAAIEASWTLLDPSEQAALAQCSIFRGGFDLDAAEAVIDFGELDPLDALERLRDRSLLAARDSGPTGKLRFFLYNSIRDFAASKLDEPALRAAVRRHASFYATRARVFSEAVSETGSATALAALALERDNLRAIPERLEPGGVDTDLLFYALLALDPLAHAEGSLEGIERHLRAIERALGGEGGTAELRLRMKATRARALLALGRAASAIAALDGARSAEALLVEAYAHAALGAPATARERAIEAQAVAARSGQQLFAAKAEAALGAFARDAGQLIEAAERFASARSAFRSMGARADEGQAALAIGAVRAALGEAEEAAGLVTDACDLLAGAADPRLPAAARSALGGVALDLGRGAEARAACEEALTEQRRLADRGGEAMTLWRLACVHLDEGDLDRTETEALAARERAPCARTKARALGVLACVAWDRGDFGAGADHAREASRGARSSGDRLAVAHLCALLGAIEATRGRSAEATQAFEDARRAHEGASSGVVTEIVALAEAFEDLRRGRELVMRSGTKGADDRESRARVRARLARMLALPSLGGVSLVQRSFAARALARRLQRALSPLDRSLLWAEALDPGCRALVLDLANRAVRLPGASADAWISMAGSRAVFRGLAALVRQRIRNPGRRLSAAELAEVLWPGDERPDEDTLARVEAEVLALRAMGLGDRIVVDSEGVGIRMDVAVLEVPGTI